MWPITAGDRPAACSSSTTTGTPTWRWWRSSRRRAATASRACCSPTRSPTPRSAASRRARWWPRGSGARCTSGSATGSSARSTCGSVGRTLPELDRLLEHDLALERAVHRALSADLHQPLALIFRQLLWELHGHLEARERAALRGRVVHVDGYFADVPPLPLGVHLHRDRRARGEARGEQLLRARPAVLAALVARLVSGERVPTDLDLLLEPPVHAARSRSHRLPSNCSGSGSSAKRAIAKSASESRLR